jgi:uncharacterized protein (DUF2141 family)
MFVFQMKQITHILTCFFILQSFAAKAQEPVVLTVTINGFKSTKGTVKIQMVDENNKDVFTKVDKLDAKTYKIQINVFVKGKYALNVIHDRNNNNKLDTNGLGIPKEGWGCSNDARGFMGAPKFKDKLVEIKQDKTVTINLVHY